jgi:type IV pilus assembly protein PilQ
MTSRGKCQIRIAVIAGVLLLSGAGPGADGVRRAQADNWLKRMVEAQRALDAAADTTPQPDRGDRDEGKQRGPEPPPPSDDLADNAINVSAAGTVEMHVANASLATVLHVLSAESHRNIIATPGVTGTVTAHLYNVTFEEALDAVLVANQAGYREVGNFIYVYTNDELAKLAERESPPVSRVFSLFYISARDASAIVTPMLSQGGTAVAAPEPDKGLSSAKEEGGGESNARQSYLVVHDRPEVLERVAATLRELDVRPTQVLVEATILGVTLSDENSLGVDFTVVGGVDLELLGSTSTAVTNLNVGELPTDRFEKFNSNVTTDFTGTVPDGGMTIGVIKDHVGVFVRALESISDAMVLANPKVLALNKQKAQVIVGRRDGYLTTTVTETQAIQTVEFLETGTQLIFRPFIGDDGYVRMELHPEDSVGTVAGGLPSEQTTEVTTNVIVRDGQTILIGGLFREVNSDGRSQIPVLGDLPVVGAAFRGRSDRTIRQEVIILLTVHIVKDQDRYAQAGEAARQDNERIRVGMRRHLMWTGRERLAQAHYRKALEQYTAGDLDKAQWNVRLALHNNPELLAAIQLKEEILGRRSWDDDGSMIRGFIQGLIAEEQGVVQPEFGRPAPPFIPPAALYGPTPIEKKEANDGQ